MSAMQKRMEGKLCWFEIPLCPDPIAPTNAGPKPPGLSRIPTAKLPQLARKRFVLPRSL